VRRYYGNYTAFDGTPQLNYQQGDFLGGGLFYWTEESIEIDNLMTFPAATGGTWVRVIESGQPFDIRWSGAYGNGLNDDAQAMVNAFNMMDITINGEIEGGTPPTSFPDIYGKIGNTIFLPAGSYYISGSTELELGFRGKVVGHQYFNSNSLLSSEFIIPSTSSLVYFVCQEFSNLNIKTQGSGSSDIHIKAVRLSGCHFGQTISIYPFTNPYPPNASLPNMPFGTMTIQGCQFFAETYFPSILVYGGSSAEVYSPQLIINGSVFQSAIELETDLSDLVINDCYYMNSSGDYVPGIPPVTTNGYSISATSPSVNPITLTSGTTYTNPSYLMTATIRIPVLLSATSTEPAEVNVRITDQYGNGTSTIMAGASTGLADIGVRQTITFNVPPQASYTVTATNATLGEGTISYNTTAVSLNATSVSLQ
jgi:hypothetical protein